MEDDDTTRKPGSRRREPSPPRSTSAKHGKASDISDGTSPSRNLGGALRSIYQATVGEDIPAEMLDLLGKLD